MPNIIPFDLLPQSDLVIDSIYEGGSIGNVGDDPLSRLMYCGNQGGFRRVGRNSTRYAILYSSFDENDWPDKIDIYSGKLIYYGDNRQPGRTINDTPRGGNRFLEEIFRNLHSNPPQRSEIPPIFVFSRYPTENSSRSVQFRGLVVPGAGDFTSTEDLIAIWKSSQNQRFQNYKAVFTVLNIPNIPRSWIEDIRGGNVLTSNCLEVYSNWILHGTYSPLISPPTIQYRTIDQQTPQTNLENSIILLIYNYFIAHPTDFEHCAAELIRMYDPRFMVDEITRTTADGGM